MSATERWAKMTEPEQWADWLAYRKILGKTTSKEEREKIKIDYMGSDYDPDDDTVMLARK